MDGNNKITKKTLIPLGLVISICGGVAWFTSFKLDANYTKDRVAAVENKQDVMVKERDEDLKEHNAELKSIDERLSRIEGWFEKWRHAGR